MLYKQNAWRRRKYRVSVYKLNVQILSQTPGVTTQRVYTVKQRSDDFELGEEDEMEPTSSVILFNIIT